jgi:predicted nucleic acid-binding protein
VSYLVDTNVISELPRPRPNAAVVAWLETQETIAISAVTVEELTYGVERARGPNAAALRRWLTQMLALPPVVVPIDERVARVAGRLRAERARRGRPAAQADMLIAATALVTARVLVTRNTRHFEGCGVPLLDPFV